VATTVITFPIDLAKKTILGREMTGKK